MTGQFFRVQIKQAGKQRVAGLMVGRAAGFTAGWAHGCGSGGLCFRRGTAHQQPQNAAQSFGQLVAVNDHIDHAMLQQILRALKPSGSFSLIVS